LYRDVAVVTVSASTRDDLRRLGFRARIAIIPEGIEPILDPHIAKSNEPSFLYVGRLAPSKRVDDVVRAFATFCGSGQPARLCLLGDGSPAYVGKLRDLVGDLGLSQRVRFAGRVDNPGKHHEMAMAHMLLLASVREGWGLVVTEANALGTPAVAYDVPGLRDSIRHQATGILVEPTHQALGEAMISLWNDRDLYGHLAAAAKAWSRTFSFDRTTTALRNELAALLTEPRRRHVDGAAVGK